MCGVESVGDPDPFVTDLQQQILELKLKLLEAQDNLDKALFWLENIKGDDNLVKFYTGFPDYEIMMAFYEEILESDASVCASVEWKKKWVWLWWDKHWTCL